MSYRFTDLAENVAYCNFTVTIRQGKIDGRFVYVNTIIQCHPEPTAMLKGWILAPSKFLLASKVSKVPARVLGTLLPCKSIVIFHIGQVKD